MQAKLLCILLLLTGKSLAQSSSYTPYDQDIYNWLDRAAILSGGNSAQRLGTVRPYLRKDIAALADSLTTDRQPGQREQALRQFIIQDNNEFFTDSLTRRKGIFNALYRE